MGFAQPLTVIGVLCLISAPLCATNSVGIVSAAIFFLLLTVTNFVLPPTRLRTRLLTVTVVPASHRLVLAPSAENGPSGRFSSNVPTGTSGTVWNVELVMFGTPALLATSV